MFWRAPELLRDETSARGTQKGDVYSFAIIVYEMFRRSEHGSPYEDILPVGQIIDLIKNPHGNDFKRPDMKALLDPSLPVEVPPYIKGIFLCTTYIPVVRFSYMSICSLYRLFYLLSSIDIFPISQSVPVFLNSIFLFTHILMTGEKTSQCYSRNP